MVEFKTSRAEVIVVLIAVERTRWLIGVAGLQNIVDKQQALLALEQVERLDLLDDAAARVTAIDVQASEINALPLLGAGMVFDHLAGALLACIVVVVGPASALQIEGPDHVPVVPPDELRGFNVCEVEHVAVRVVPMLRGAGRVVAFPGAQKSIAVDGVLVMTRP